MTDLNGRVALITGSARGIGRAIAERYASLGASIVINYTTAEAQARETVVAIEQMATTAIAVQANVSEVADVDRLFDTALDRFGGLGDRCLRRHRQLDPAHRDRWRRDLAGFVSGQHLLISGGAPA